MEDKLILLVEDNEDDVELTRRALEKNKISNRIVVAHDGVEALDFLFCEGPHADRDPADQPQLVLLDINMPRLGGLEVLERIRADERTQMILVVILTSSREEGDLVRGYTNRVNSYIQKPVDFGQFTEAVRHLGLYWLVLNVAPPSGS
ncbi:MAG: response regulator [Gemmatimonadota bacterium]